MNTSKTIMLSAGAVCGALLMTSLPEKAKAYSYYYGGGYDYNTHYGNAYGNCYYHGRDGACYNYSTYSYPYDYGNDYYRGYKSYHPYDVRTRSRSYQNRYDYRPYYDRYYDYDRYRR